MNAIITWYKRANVAVITAILMALLTAGIIADEKQAAADPVTVQTLETLHAAPRFHTRRRHDTGKSTLVYRSSIPAFPQTSITLEK